MYCPLNFTASLLLARGKRAIRATLIVGSASDGFLASKARSSPICQIVLMANHVAAHDIIDMWWPPLGGLIKKEAHPLAAGWCGTRIRAPNDLQATKDANSFG